VPVLVLQVLPGLVLEPLALALVPLASALQALQEPLA
tara:strand:+ start:330 stop:440 length:111 start_codon:yes stop_codon:yes gene_type:complete